MLFPKCPGNLVASCSVIKLDAHLFLSADCCQIILYRPLDLGHSLCQTKLFLCEYMLEYVETSLIPLTYRPQWKHVPNSSGRVITRERKKALPSCAIFRYWRVGVGFNWPIREPNVIWTHAASHGGFRQKGRIRRKSPATDFSSNFRYVRSSVINMKGECYG